MNEYLKTMDKSDLYCKFVTNKPYTKKIYWSKSKHTEHFDLPFQDLSTKQEIKPKMKTMVN